MRKQFFQEFASAEALADRCPERHQAPKMITPQNLLSHRSEAYHYGIEQSYANALANAEIEQLRRTEPTRPLGNAHTAIPICVYEDFITDFLDLKDEDIEAFCIEGIEYV